MAGTSEADALERSTPMKITFAILAAALTLSPAALLAQNPTHAPGEIGQRQENQQDRIGQGVKSGQLTAGETSHLEHQEAGIQQEKRGMRAQDNGKLTRQDKRTLNRQQNRESHRIYRDKHNSRKQ